ncbi:arginine/serine-rich protein 1 [Anoplopoma fimbria]|uniref:arginine/serine-rich protein 1 n=1 Tax=Anoplopoma fimbria TaxID=229290 RepID=UPI0023EAAAD7|nr:arginine/serine-rich protein 1 [Anoplopoma fimbria]
MTKGDDSYTEIAHVRQGDVVDVLLDQTSSASIRSRSRSRSSGGKNRRSLGSGHKGRSGHRRRRRSSSSSSNSRSSSQTRSRSHPRCHRPSSRCRCDNHRRARRSRRSPQPRRHRAPSGSPSPSRRRNGSSSRRSRHRTVVSRSSTSPPRTHSSSSRSGSSEPSVNLSFDGKPIQAAGDNAATILGVEKLELPESVEPIQSEQVSESQQTLRERWVRQDPEKTPSESSDAETDDIFSRRMSPKRKIISFSINNTVLKPTMTASSGAKVTSRVDSYESRRPYGHWMPVKARHTSSARKHTLAMSH